ncbi:asparaginase domain-containing protein [Stutzerimonas sp. R40042]|uniref:asparaginase domain-containing protein n=1 Tax=Stutzerimonas sp. R40042 TaxID=2998559 RepID=UPI002278D216|nr:asparaginase domain-containing protein [Stutzerimonas sp. R40042]WAE60020.1 asparaginase domain-containing protein [Stutzerimonas sp. R40042]WCR44047.1 asparaginase domain-containing protein [Stutzerimonas stutzeri]
MNKMQFPSTSTGTAANITLSHGVNMLQASRSPTLDQAPDTETVKKLVVLHTGGTIGMVPGLDGLTPAQGVLEQAIESLSPDDVNVTVLAFDPLVDSAEVSFTHWNRMIDLITGSECDGFVITHGTDTMAFTGAALSLALSGIDVPVVLCGSMLPLNTGGDAEGNLLLALKAASENRAGVWLAFASKLLPAGGLIKHNSHDADAFRSVPQLPEAELPRRCCFKAKHLAILTLSPGLPASAVGAALKKLDGAVLRVFGAGTVMSDPLLESVLKEAVASGCRIRAVSQCEAGGLHPGAYAAGGALWRAGVENGGTETPEAALARLWIDLSM